MIESKNKSWQFINGKVLFLFILLIISETAVISQIKHAGSPYQNTLKSANIVPVIVLDSLVNSINVSDSVPEKFKIKKVSKLIPVEIDFFSRASSFQTNDFAVYRLTLQATGAKNLGVLFSKYRLPDNVKIFLIDDNGNFNGAFTSLNNKSFGSLMVSPVNGQRVTIEVQVGNQTSFFPDLMIGGITFGYTDLKEGLNSDELSSGFCNVDVNCFEDNQVNLLKHSVVRLKANGEDLCTGTLLNNNLNDGKAYVLTANHCIGSYAAARNTIFYFNYETIDCDGLFNYNYKTISGSELKATKKSLDFTLVEISIEPPYLFFPYYAGWSRDTLDISNTYSIHHPDGDFKKISIDDDPPVITDAEGYEKRSLFKILEWNTGTTEGGSSGCALFDMNDKIIGLLSGGDAVCGNSVNDFYVQFARAWNDFPDTSSQLKYWLDPLNDDPVSHAGFDPYGDFKTHNYQPTNIDKKNETLTLQKTDSWGYITGHNDDFFDMYAEEFTINETETHLTGFNIHVAKAKKASSFATIRFQVWKDNLEDASIVYYKNVGMEYLKEDVNMYIPSDSLIPVQGKIFIGYRVFYSNVQDTFAVYHSAPRNENQPNTAFAHSNKTGWIPIYEIRGENSSASMDMGPALNNLTGISKRHTLLHNKVFIYPNPVNHVLNIRFLKPGVDLINIYNISGQLVKSVVPDNQSTEAHINVSGLDQGFHVLKIHTGSGVDFYKFMVSH